MNHLPDASTQVSLDVGGLGFDLVCSCPVLARGLAARYRDYPAHSSERFVAKLYIHPGEGTASLLQHPMRFSHGVLTWEAPGCQGVIDPFKHMGSLILSTNQPEAEAEYFLRAACALQAFETGGLLFHAAGIVRKGQAFAFFGHSGSGKSTVARLSVGDAVLNDDLVLLMPSHGQWWVHPTPFWNLPGVGSPVSAARLAGMYRLVQDLRVYLQPLQGANAVAEMLASAPVVSADPARSTLLIQRCQAILSEAPAYRLHFLPDASFWQAIDGV